MTQKKKPAVRRASVAEVTRDCAEDKPSRSPQQLPASRTLFAPLPPRAMADLRLSALHFRVLIAVACHDRMSRRRKTVGCWASHATLCEEIGCNYNNLSTAISDLVKFDYLRSRKQEHNKRLRIYTVLYDSSPIDEVSTAIVRPIVRPNGPIVRPARFQAPDNKGGKATKESLENRTYEREPTGIDTRERASFAKSANDANTEREKFEIDAQLAILERRLKREKCSREDREAAFAFCQHITEQLDTSDSAFQRARRLLEEYLEETDDDGPTV